MTRHCTGQFGQSATGVDVSEATSNMALWPLGIGENNGSPALDCDSAILPEYESFLNALWFATAAREIWLNSKKINRWPAASL